MMKLLNMMKLHENVSNVQEPVADNSPLMAVVAFQIATTMLIFFASTPRLTRALRELSMPSTALAHQLTSFVFLADVGVHACELISPGDSLEKMLWWFNPIAFAIAQGLAPVLIYTAVQFRDWKALGLIGGLAPVLFATAFPLDSLLDMKTRLGVPLFHGLHMMGHVLFSVLYARVTTTLQCAIYGQAKK